MIRRPPRSTHCISSAASDVYKRQMYEFKVDLVATPLLSIKIYDYDYIGRDLIGETVINLDDRYYSPFWRSLPEKPIEDRSLHLDESATEQGRIRLWVDMFKAGEETPAWNITPQPDAVSCATNVGIRTATSGVGNQRHRLLRYCGDECRVHEGVCRSG
eukprot:TRINITY_DN1777_c0_g1_i13.p1 TRINITY_DN1777_c0_g1~~TRINITY_DN1777_c0_g1_i13.p1  ORF type:complete len:167 (-),score=29.85 TRINITY_DN1777_c0_g1_i13:775-1251(-)